MRLWAYDRDDEPFAAKRAGRAITAALRAKSFCARKSEHANSSDERLAAYELFCARAATIGAGWAIRWKMVKRHRLIDQAVARSAVAWLTVWVRD